MLSAILLPTGWAWFLNGFAMGCLAFLCFQHVTIEALEGPNRLEGVRGAGLLDLASQGLLVAFLACSSVIVYFTTRLTTELRRREHDLREPKNTGLAARNSNRWRRWRPVRRTSWRLRCRRSQWQRRNSSGN